MRPISTSFVLVLLFASGLLAQSMQAQPYDARLRTDPSVGNVQGVQRYGRPLKTDPDQGVGFSYHVYPVADDGSAGLQVANQVMLSQLLQNATRQAVSHAPVRSNNLTAEPPIELELPTETLDQLQAENRASQQQTAAIQALAAMQAYDAYGPSANFLPQQANPQGYSTGPGLNTFDATRGLRNFQTGRQTADVLSNPLAAQAVLRAQAFGIAVDANEIVDLYHQPLIQIRLRVVEVARNHGFQANSILEYVSQGGGRTATSGTPANDSAAQKNLRGISRFATNALTDAATNGTGALVNLTSEHINWALQVLATEFEGDVVTAPEVVTLNGQNVEFVSGKKIPFQLGQNVIQGTNNNIQQFFYKNVGTYVSVTPKIVNWGFYGEGKGEASLVDTDIQDWNRLASALLDRSRLESLASVTEAELTPYAQASRPIPVAIQRKMLAELNRYRRTDLLGKPIQASDGTIVHEGGVPGIFDILTVDAIGECATCNWKPDDCTIDLALVVRLSDAGRAKITIDGDEPESVLVSTEDNVRAIANVIQVKSGEGVVMAGLIGQREETAINKVPILGDIPYVGALFRDKVTVRQKTELLIFIEARVLDRSAPAARTQSAEDFQLSRPYLNHALLDNPLECGMHRAGMGTYLPPAGKAEAAYWKQHRRDIRKTATAARDLLR